MYVLGRVVPPFVADAAMQLRVCVATRAELVLSIIC